MSTDGFWARREDHPGGQGHFMRAARADGVIVSLCGWVETPPVRVAPLTTIGHNLCMICEGEARKGGHPMPNLDKGAKSVTCYDPAAEAAARGDDPPSLDDHWPSMSHRERWKETSHRYCSCCAEMGQPEFVPGWCESRARECPDGHTRCESCYAPWAEERIAALEAENAKLCDEVVVLRCASPEGFEAAVADMRAVRAANVALEAEVALLREALKPFAQCWQEHAGPTAEAFRRADEVDRAMGGAE